MWPVARVPAGQMEATTFDIFRNLKWCQCDWLRCVYKGTKGTTGHFIMSDTRVALCVRSNQECHSTAICWTNDITSNPSKEMLRYLGLNRAVTALILNIDGIYL